MAIPPSLWQRYGGHLADGRVLNFGDPVAEYGSLKEGAALLDWSGRTHFLVSGPEPEKLVAFVNGQVSNDAKALRVGQGMRAAILNRFGKILADCDVVRLEQGFVVTVDTVNAQKIDEHLGRAAFLSKCPLADFDADHVHLRLLGPAAIRLAQEAFSDVGSASTAPAMSTMALETAHGSVPCMDSFLASGAAHAAITKLVECGARLAGAQAYEWWRIEAGLPKWGADFNELNILPEVDDTSWVSYTKGCYTGQEIVAKVRSHGGPVRRVMPLLLGQATGVPAPLLREGKEVGTLTSAAQLPGGRVVGLGLLMRAAWTACGLQTPQGIRASIR